nr:hypothetical protein [Saprospiraceae bacterium]
MRILLFIFCIGTALFSCSPKLQDNSHKTAAEILGNPDYLAISYGSYREKTRDVQATIPQLKEDMKILAAMGIKLLRTYNVHY